MKKSHIVLIVIAGILVTVLPFCLIFGVAVFDSVYSEQAKIEIDSYRLCEDKDGNDVIIIKYLLDNKGKEPTTLIYEGDFYVYQDGVSLTEVVDELPKKCDYDSEDQYKNIKGGKQYYAEIAYKLEYPEKDVEVEVDDYGLFDDKKEKIFKLK